MKAYYMSDFATGLWRENTTKAQTSAVRRRFYPSQTFWIDSAHAIDSLVKTWNQPGASAFLWRRAFDICGASMKSYDLTTWQIAQHKHDCRNHADIHSLHKTERLKHYGLHFAKYVGRIARGNSEAKPVERTIVDCMLVCLSTANTLHQNLGTVEIAQDTKANGRFFELAEATGRFADACEKIDHLENFVGQARAANSDIAHLLVSWAGDMSFNLYEELGRRRIELAARQFYIQD